MRVLGYDTFHLRATSTAKWGITRLRVALVLDNTGSMDSAGKMTALKTATKSLIDQLHGAVTTDGDVYVSIIPFAKDVNLGKSNFAADWIYWGTAPADNNVNNPGLPIQDSTTSDNTSWNATRGTCSSGSWSTRSDMFRERRHLQRFGIYGPGFLHQFGNLQPRGLQLGEHLHKPRHLFKSVIYEEKQLPEPRRHMDREYLDLLQRHLDGDRNMEAQDP